MAPSSHAKAFLAIGPYCSCAASVVQSHTNRSSFFVQSIRLTNHYPFVQTSMVYGDAPSVCQTYFPALFYTCLFTTWEFKIFATFPLGYGALIVMAPVGFEPTLTKYLLVLPSFTYHYFLHYYYTKNFKILQFLETLIFRNRIFLRNHLPHRYYTQLHRNRIPTYHHLIGLLQCRLSILSN